MRSFAVVVSPAVPKPTTWVGWSPVDPIPAAVETILYPVPSVVEPIPVASVSINSCTENTLKA